jgi:hypothetical protein
VLVLIVVKRRGVVHQATPPNNMLLIQVTHVSQIGIESLLSCVALCHGSQVVKDLTQCLGSAKTHGKVQSALLLLPVVSEECGPRHISD